jgi:glycosyltransferase involved in cell wall biosynthesis
MIGPDTARAWRRFGGRVARLAGRDATFDWHSWYRRAAQRAGPEAVLHGHAAATHLDQDFNVFAYLENNPDVADVVASPGEAAFHYLEFGHAEARNARPVRWDPGFVRRHDGLDLPYASSAVDANSALHRAGIPITGAYLHEADLWLAQGVFGQVFAQIFDHEFYAVAAETAGHALPAVDRASAITHFCATGLAAGIPPHPDHVLDAPFYRDACAFADVVPPSDADNATLLRHWARTGVRAGAHANPRAWFHMRTAVPLPNAVLEAIAAFRAASVDLDASASLPETLAHLAAVPIPGAAVFDRAAPGVEGFLIDLARHKRWTGDPGAAEWLLMRVIDHAPGHPRASLDLADLIHGQNRIGTEIQLRRAVPSDFDIGANGIILAERLVSQNRLSEALDVCDQLPVAVAGDVALRRRRRDLGAAIFNAVWGDLSTRIASTPVSDLQALLSRALALYTPPFDTPQRSAPIRRAAVLANDDLYQCKLYRADQKIDQLRNAGYTVDLFVQSRDLDRLHDRLDLYDAIIFIRVPAFLPIIDLIAAAAQQGLATFYDCDDLIFDPALFPPPLSTYAGQITATDHAAIACGVPLFRHAMALCDYGIASTPTIRDAMADVVRTGEVFLHRNALGASHLRVLDHVHKVARRPRDKLVIHYGSGTKAHKAEFTEVLEPALAEVLARRPGKVEIRIIGDFPGLRHLDPAHPDVRLLPPIWDFEVFCTEVAKADINLSILFPSVITDAKSEIKWMEAALFGVPSVVSPTATHREVIEEGVTGLMATDKEEFVAAMLLLVDDADLRRRIGTAAREAVLRDYALEAMGTRLDAMFAAVRPPLPAPKARLLIVNVFYPPQDIGGATRVVQDNVTDLLRLYGDDYEIDVIATLEGGEIPHHVKCYARDGARIWTITARDGIGNMDIRDHRMGDVFDSLLDRIRPDLVHLHCLQRLTVSVVDCLRRRRLPYVVTLHDGWWISPNQFVVSPDGVPEIYDFGPDAATPLPERARITRRGLEDAAARLAVSDSFADLHRRAGLDRIDTIENGVSSLPERQPVPGRAGRVRLGLIGGASRHKGYALLRAAIHARRFENLDLLLVDHALPRGQTRQEDWNGTPVTILPRQPLDGVGTLYSRIDVLLAPSTWPESYGLVTREALALGLWVVASDRGAIGQDVTEGKNGFIVDVSNHHALVDCLAAIDADPETFRNPPAHRPELRRAQAQARDLHDLYQRILASRSVHGSEQEI